jgi:hypothetical protein
MVTEPRDACLISRETLQRSGNATTCPPGSAVGSIPGTMDDQKEKRLAIVDGRYVGFLRPENVLNSKDGAPMLILEEALEIVSALIPQQTPHGIATLRLSMVHPIAMCTEPKSLPIRYSTILFVDADLNEQERKALNDSLKNCRDNLRKAKMQRETGLILPKG